MSAMTADDLRRILIESGGAAEFFEEYGGAPSGDALLDEPFDELGYDSIQVLEIAGHIERKLGVTLPDNLMAGTRTLRDLLLAVNAAAAQAAR